MAEYATMKKRKERLEHKMVSGFWTECWRFYFASHMDALAAPTALGLVPRQNVHA